MNQQPHTLKVTFDGNDATFAVECHHDHTAPADPSTPWDEPPCACWTESTKPCICRCEPCQAGEHEDCEEDYIENVGRKWCQAVPEGQCWYIHVMDEVGLEAFTVYPAMVLRISVHLSGHSWDDPIGVVMA